MDDSVLHRGRSPGCSATSREACNGCAPTGGAACAVLAITVALVRAAGYFWMTSPSTYAALVEAGRTTTVPERVEAESGSHVTWRTFVVAL